MNLLDTYVKELSEIRSSGAAIKEIFYCGPLANLILTGGDGAPIPGFGFQGRKLFRMAAAPVAGTRRAVTTNTPREEEPSRR
jgi:hypothetical protein